MTQSMAVNPAVPIAIACASESAVGQRQQPVGLDPRALGEAAPVALADAPAGEQHLVAGREARIGRELATVPAKSMPGTNGNWRTILPAPVIASASL